MKKILLASIVLIGIGSINSVSAQNSRQHSIEISNKNEKSKEGFNPSPATLNIQEFERSECISTATREEVRQTIKENKKKILEKDPDAFQGSKTGHPLFIWPIRAKEGFEGYGYYTVNFLVDHNSTPNNNLTDYNCDDRTYDWGNGNHEGTDLILWPYPWKRMQEEVMEIVAAAEGIIVDKRDGNFDGNCVNDGNENWNGLVIEHSDGSEAWYWHFKDGAITSKGIGESVEAGEYLGAAGSSGSSNWPHLHFEVYDTDNNLIDPFAGECNDMNSDSWWDSQPEYYEPQINHISTHDTTAFDENCPNPEITYEQDNFNAGDQLVIRIFYKDLQTQANTNLQLISPNGDISSQFDFESPWEDYATASAFWTYDITETWPDGEYIVRATFDGEIYETHFTVGSGVGLRERHEIGFSVFPNPANGEITINGIINFEDERRVRVFDLLGNELFNSSIEKNEYRLETAGFSQGVYFLQISDRYRTATRKIVIRH